MRLEMAGDALIMTSASSTCPLIRLFGAVADAVVVFTAVRIYVISSWNKRRLACMLVLGLLCPVLSTVCIGIRRIGVYVCLMCGQRAVHLYHIHATPHASHSSVSDVRPLYAFRWAHVSRTILL